ncbi:PREDICTED: target of Myb protein 1-like isoform X1 [Nelumbo nucifera]|uniref:Target of Myb protein 1-like isoform X1 n=2 Tax=Nelumbo nucifera TaxID=4432 RepID=A0A1U7ZXG6_NELNU|nr:PREDICTED: target of Myb protein 1-like isoform X1 [Nelumbo nucifera]
MSSSVTVRVEKATSDLLIGPDWTMNMDICDTINSNHWQAKDVVKALKRRLQNKNPKVQLLALTLLETMTKNCGDYVHFQIAERDVLQEMIKIVKKKTDMHVRDKILILLDSWQEAFGGPGGKYPQYYWAYEELRVSMIDERSGVEFPRRSSDAAQIFTPPVTHRTLRHTQAGYGFPNNTTRRLDEAMASEVETLSLSNIDSMRSVMELLTEMLQAVNPNDREAVKDEVIVDLVSQCRSNQKRLIQMLTSTVDEEILGQGLALNDNLQSVLAKHNAIASGSPLPTEVREPRSRPSEGRDNNTKPPEVSDNVNKLSEVGDANFELSEVRDATRNVTSMSKVVTKAQLDEEDDEDDGFAQLARRHSKTAPLSSQSKSAGMSESCAPMDMANFTAPSTPEISIPNKSSALSLLNPPAPVRTATKEQDMIDLLSLTLSEPLTSPHTPLTTPSISNHNMHQVPASPTTQGYPYGPQTYPGNQGPVSYNSYIVPWAQPKPQSQAQPQFTEYSSSYPPPPWATAPAYSDQSPLSTTASYMSTTPQANASSSHTPLQMARPFQHYNSFSSRGSNGSPVQREAQLSSSERNSVSATEQKTFIPSYRLFEDLNVLGNADRGFKRTNSTSPSLSGMSGQGIVGGRK